MHCADKMQFMFIKQGFFVISSFWREQRLNTKISEQDNEYFKIICNKKNHKDYG